jgi:hypothetical protein
MILGNHGGRGFAAKAEPPFGRRMFGFAERRSPSRALPRLAGGQRSESPLGFQTSCLLGWVARLSPQEARASG